MKLTPIKVLRSNAGFYIGTECLDEEIGCYIPNERLSGYYPSREAAGTALTEDTYFRP
jgi:hypothetical protein